MIRDDVQLFSGFTREELIYLLNFIKSNDYLDLDKSLAENFRIKFKFLGYLSMVTLPADVVDKMFIGADNEKENS